MGKYAPGKSEKTPTVLKSNEEQAMASPCKYGPTHGTRASKPHNMVGISKGVMMIFTSTP